MLTNLTLCWECGALRPPGDEPCPHCSWQNRKWSRRIERVLGFTGSMATCLSSTAVRGSRTARALIPAAEITWELPPATR